jgi:hypothetical protein
MNTLTTRILVATKYILFATLLAVSIWAFIGIRKTGCLGVLVNKGSAPIIVFVLLMAIMFTDDIIRWLSGGRQSTIPPEASSSDTPSPTVVPPADSKIIDDDE